jgi:glycosyltransferase involved in cell wall biosynthesis
MRTSMLKDLPPPPPGKTGWPWTEENPFLREDLPDDKRYPRLSIITPSYNQGFFLEETIRSVLLQGYPDLEYVVIDGGSTDGSVEIIRKYEPWLAYWISEPDGGQTEAINRGFHRTSGEIIAWINSDDIYCPGALRKIAKHFVSSSCVDLLYGDCEMIDNSGSLFGRFNVRSGGPIDLLKDNFIAQPSAFCTRNAWQKAGGVDEKLHYSMDYDLWLRIFLGGMATRYVPEVYSRFRYHHTSKSGTKSVQFAYEYLAILDKIGKLTCDSMLLQARFRAYHQTYAGIAALYEVMLSNSQERRNALFLLLDMWALHLEKLSAEYGLVPIVFSQTCCSIGKYYCLLGDGKRGREFFTRAIRAKGGLLSRAPLAWLLTFLGERPFRWHQKRIRALETGLE